MYQNYQNITPCYHLYIKNDYWTTEEIEAYNAALMKCDKDFFNIAKEVKSKTVKQCIQFYYLWKKVCPDEYKRLRNIRRKKENEASYRLRNQQREEPPPPPPPQRVIHEFPNELTEQVDKIEGSSDGQMSVSPVETCKCEFPDCGFMFSSRQALNNHARIHSKPVNNTNTTTTATTTTTTINNIEMATNPLERSPSGTSSVKTSSVVTNPTSVATTTDFPCRLCGKVFTKIKSRCAHMKSHRIAEAERKVAKFHAVSEG